MKPIVLEGQRAFSDFRMTRLMESIAAAMPGFALSRIEATYVYFLQATAPLSDDTRQKAQAPAPSSSSIGRPPSAPSCSHELCA